MAKVIKQVEVVEVEKIKMEAFSFENLRMLTDGLYKYVCKDIEAIADDLFSCDIAKNYGIRVGHIVMVSDGKKVKLVPVG